MERITIADEKLPNGYTNGEILALIHSEWSEALEEYRNGRPLLYTGCRNDLSCTDAELEGRTCTYRSIDDASAGLPCPYTTGKPEGIAVELIDGCIRILDYMRKRDFIISSNVKDSDDLLAAEKAAIETQRKLHDRALSDYRLPDLVAMLHYYTAESGVGKNIQTECLPLLDAIGAVFIWVEGHGCDPMVVMQQKHEYNKSRPYRHGGKLC